MKKCGCKKCAVVGEQPLSAFTKNKAMKGGLSNYCRACQQNANKVYSKANLPKMAAKARRLRLKLKLENPQKAWELKRNQRLKAQYGITLHVYNSMFVSQKGLCGICARPASDFPKKLVVDHCHKTGKVRKLLCGLCNQMLGSAKENINTLLTAIAYLKEFKNV